MDTPTKQKTYSVMRDLKRRSGVLTNLIKETTKNPGRGLRKITAGTVKDPITGTVIIGSQLAPIPGVGTATMAVTPKLAAVSKTVLSPGTQKKLRTTAKNMMSDNGATRASRIGRGIEYYTNKSLMKMSDIAQKFPI